jgi:hypothetical protein
MMGVYMINETRTEVVDVNGCNSYYKYPHKRISWSAIIAGAIVAFTTSFLLNLFGVAIGLAAFTNTQAGVKAFAIGGFIGLIIVAIASMFLGGMVAGHLGRRYCVRRNLGVLYGILTFGISLFMVVLLTHPMTKFLSQYNEGLYGPSYRNTAVIANPTSSSSTIISSESAITQVPAVDSTSSSAAATEKNTNDVGKVALLTFVLFAIGAFSACLGGHCGMTSKCNDEDYVVDEKLRRTPTDLR